MKNKKRILSISIDEKEFQELTEAAASRNMNRSTYVKTLLDRARNTDVPLEILLITRYFENSKGADIDPAIKKNLDEPIKQLIDVLSEGECNHGKIQSSKKNKQNKRRSSI